MASGLGVPPSTLRVSHSSLATGPRAVGRGEREDAGQRERAAALDAAVVQAPHDSLLTGRVTALRSMIANVPSSHMRKTSSVLRSAQHASCGSLPFSVQDA